MGIYYVLSLYRMTISLSHVQLSLLLHWRYRTPLLALSFSLNIVVIVTLAPSAIPLSISCSLACSNNDE